MKIELLDTTLAKMHKASILEDAFEELCDTGVLSEETKKDLRSVGVDPDVAKATFEMQEV